MIHAMRTAATGMHSQQRQIDIIANNLSNVNTTGFKRSKLEFQDLLYQNLSEAGIMVNGGSTTPASLQVGSGVRPVVTQKIFTMGELMETGSALDLVVEGSGFFQVLMPDGSVAYTRDGSLKISGEGDIVTSDGYFLEPRIVVPSDAASMSISADGTASVILTGDDEPVDIGELTLARFINPAGLKSIGHNLFQKTQASGQPIVAEPGTEGLGTLLSGYLESSNVEVVQEMVNMILAQRAYEITSKAIQASDEMMSLANNLRR